MENKDSTETYLNLGSEQFNTWIKEFEQKYNKLEEKSNINNYDSFTNSDIISDEISDNLLEESSDEESESESVFVKNPSTESSNKKKILFSKYKTSIKKSNPKSSDSNLKEEFKNMDKQNINKKNINKQKTKLSENISSEKFNQPIKIEEEIISLKELNLMIPDKLGKETNNDKVDRQNNNFFVNENVQKKNKLGDTALYKFISNRRR